MHGKGERTAAHAPRAQCCTLSAPAAQGPAGIVVDAGGNPVGSALRLEALGAPPRALAASAPFLLVASEAGIHVFDRDSGAEVQRLGFGPGLHPLPGQPLHAAAAAGAAPGAGAGAGGCVVVAGRRLVWLCSPVPPADQARELLAQGDYAAALELIQAGLRQGAAWAQVAAAQAALLLLHGEGRRLAGRAGPWHRARLPHVAARLRTCASQHPHVVPRLAHTCPPARPPARPPAAECRFEEALGCLEAVSPATFQPSQLFPLFPAYAAPWAQQARGPGCRLCRLSRRACVPAGRALALGPPLVWCAALAGAPSGADPAPLRSPHPAGAHAPALLGPACAAAQPGDPH